VRRASTPSSSCARLAQQPYLGAQYSLADLIVGSTITCATYCGVPVQAHANVQAWLARFHARPAFRKTWDAAA
jgi:GST-like protein